MKLFFIYQVLLLSFTINASAQKNIVFLVGERENSTSQTMPSLAISLEDQFKYKTFYINIPKNGAAENIELIKKADLLICYMHLRYLPQEQIDIINTHIESGKPVIAFNSTSRAFARAPKWFSRYFGGAHRGSVTEEGKSTVTVIPEQIQHPIMRDLGSLNFATDKAISIPGPLNKSATPLLMGKRATSPAFPVAWTYKSRKNMKVFYTSLGSAEDFKNKTFQKMVYNAVQWCFSNEKTPNTSLKKYPDPPELNAPKNAVILFDGKDLKQWEHWDLLQNPHSIEIDEQIQKFSNMGFKQKINWKVKDKAIVTEPGSGDIISKKNFGNYLLNIDFLLPEEPDYIEPSTRGSGGIFISGRYEIRLNAGSEQSKTGPNSIYTVRAPDHSRGMTPGVWHNMKINYDHTDKGPAVISVSVNGKRVQDNIKLNKRTPYGIIEAIGKENPDDVSLHTVPQKFTSEKIKMAENDFTISTRFKTKASSGTIFARTSEITGWERDGKAFFIGSGKVYYDIGWRAMINSNRNINDGEWHHVILTNTKDMCTMYVDGEVTFMKKKFNRPDPPGHVLKIGYAFKNFFRPFEGEISNVRYYDRALKYQEVIKLSEENIAPENPILDWKPDQKKTVIKKNDEKEITLKGPIRLHGDFSRIRYANIWIKER